jgi:hypothetical protein
VSIAGNLPEAIRLCHFDRQAQPCRYWNACTVFGPILSSSSWVRRFPLLLCTAVSWMQVRVGRPPVSAPSSPRSLTEAKPFNLASMQRHLRYINEVVPRNVQLAAEKEAELRRQGASFKVCQPRIANACRDVHVAKGSVNPHHSFLACVNYQCLKASRVLPCRHRKQRI